MGFDSVIICADSYSSISLAYLCENYLNIGELQWFFLICSARWFKLFKASRYRSVLMWKNVVHAFRMANYYFRQEDNNDKHL